MGEFADDQSTGLFCVNCLECVNYFINEKGECSRCADGGNPPWNGRSDNGDLYLEWDLLALATAKGGG